MRIVKSVLFGLLPALLFAALSSSLIYAATPDRISGALTSGRTVALRGSVHRRAVPEFDQGPVDPAMRMGTITLMTSRTAAQQKAINRLLAQQQDRRSANYHKWLTPEQYADRFGLSQNDMQNMAAWLKSKGFSMIQPARGRNWISFTGTAAQVESAFGTEIHHFNVNGELHYANASSPVVPAALAGVVTGMRGLHDFLPRPRGVHRNVGLRPYYNSSAFGDLVAPGDIAAIYDIQTLYDAGIDGSGQKLAVMGQTDVYLADITDFRTGFGLSAITCTTNSSGVITSCDDPHFKYVLGGADPGVRSTTGDVSEADLDIEWSGAVARGAQIVYVNASDTFTSFYYAIDNNVAPVISLSYGFCEFDDNFVLDSSGNPIANGDEAELQKASLAGITFVNSSGDSGAAECDFSNTVSATNQATQGLAVSYPASSPQVTGVGGTAIPLANFTSQFWQQTNTANGGSATGYVPEQVWNDDAEIAQFCQGQTSGQGFTFCQQGGSTPVPGWVAINSAAKAQQDIGISSTGGGASNCAIQTADNSSCVSGFPQPSWQTVTLSGQGSVRFSPDVSFLATPNFPGYIFCTQLSELGDSGSGSACAGGITSALNLNSPPLIGGTSASAPVFAGMVTLLNQYLAANGGLGNVNPMLYSLAVTPSNGAFNPVTTGDNTVQCVAGEPSVQPAALRCPSTGVLGFQASNADTTTGFNLVAGLGSVNANHLAVAWADTLTTGFTFTSNAASYQISQGSSADATLTVSMVGGFNDTVSFTCTDSAPESTCTAPPSVNTTTNVSFHITTTPANAAMLRPSNANGGSRLLYAALLPGLLGLMFTAGSRRRSLRSIRFLALIVALGCSTMWLSSCGGGSGGGGGSSGGTPKGNYQITVNATSGSTVQTQTINLSVQ